MADGNLGSLWMSLGIKESVSKELKRIAESMTGVDSTTKKTRESLLKLANTSMEGKDARWLDKMRKSLGETSVEAKELQAVLSSIKFDGKGNGWKKLTEDIDINNLNKYASLVNEIEKTLSRMESKTGLSSAGNDLMLTVHNVRFALSQLSEIKQELSQAGGLSLSAKGLENYRASLNSLFNEGASLLSSPVANFTKLDDWVNKFDKRITDIYDSVLNQSKSVSQSATAATDSLKKEEEQAKKTAEAVASIGEKRKPAVMKESQQEAAFNKDVSNMTTVNEAINIKQKADEAKEAVVKLRYELNEVLNAFRGAASKNLGVGDAGEKGRQFVDILNQANRKMEELSKKEGGNEAVAELKAMLKNAQEYKGLLDDIRKKYNEVSDIRKINPNVDTSKIKEALGLIEHFRNQLTQLESGRFLTGVDKANVLPNYRKEWRGTVDSVNGITRGLSSTNTLSDLKNKADKANSSLSEVERNIEKLNRAIDFGKQKGYNTDNLFDNLAALRNRKAEFDRVLSKDTARLNDDAYMKGLYSETAKDIKLASDAMTHFGQVQQKVSEQEKAAAAEYDRRNAAEKQRQSAREAELKAMDAYAKRYMELVAARDKAMSSMKEAPGLRNDKGLQNISNEIDTLLNRLTKVREDITLYNQAIGNGTKESIAFGQQGLKEANAEAERLMSTIEKLQHVYDTLRNSQAHVNDLIGNSFGQMRNRDVLAKMSDFYRAEEIASAKKAAKDEAQAKRDAAKATREANAAEKQRQSELEISRRRIQSMEKALANLQEKKFTSKMLGLDTSEAEAKILNLKIQLSQLWELENKLFAKDMTAVGKLGNIGNGREVQAANDLARSYDRANKEAQKGIEIERRHQQEISATAAKVRSDLVSSFNKASKAARETSDAVRDIKSLFLQGGLVFGIQQFFNSIVKTGGEIQQQRIALQSILGDVGKANELFNQTQQLALQSPFKFGELNRDVKQLAAFGVEANDLYDTTKRLADIASGLGVSFERLGLAYGQVKARSWLDGKELRQFAYAGLPLLQRITELYNATGKNGRTDYTQADVKKMISNREVSFEDVQKVLWNMTDEGGQFYNMQFVLSETLLGKWNKLIDAWEIMLGKFADGKNVIGGTFKYAISGATDLILALDKLSPLLLSFGATFVARKGLGALYGNIAAKAGIGGILSSQKEAVNIRLREYAIQQQQLVAEKQITQEKATQKVAAMGYALASKEEQINAMQRLALEGKLSMMQMQKAYREGLITPELLSQLEVMGLISAKQKEIVANATLENRVRAMGMTAMSSVGKLFTWGNAAFLGISVAIGAIMHSFQKAEEIEQRSKDIATSAQQRINSLNEALSSTNGINKDSEAPDIERVNEQLQGVLEQSGLFTDTIKEQIEQASTLTDKYKILKGAVSDAKDASSVQGMFSDAISKAIDASGGFLNDDITENVKDVMDSYNKMQTLLVGLDEATKERMSSIANQFLKPEQASLSLEEKIDLLADMSEDDFDKFVRAASNGSNDIAHSLYLIRDRANITKDHFNEIAKDDVPKILEVIRTALGKNEKEFRSWAQHNIKSFDSMFMKIIELCNANVPTIVTKLRKIFYESVGMEPPKEPSNGRNKPKPYSSGLKPGGAGENARKKLQKSGKLNKTNYKAYDTELQIYDSDSSEEFGESLRKQYKEIRNENNARKKAGRKVSAESLARQKRIEEIAAVSGVSLDVGKDRVTGDFGKNREKKRQEDEQLKDLKTRISLYKKMYAEIKKYKDLYGKGALGQLANDGEFESIFKNKKGFPISDYTNYETSIKQILGTLPSSTKDRKDFKDSEIAGIQSENRKLAEDQRKDELDALNRQLDVIQEQYDTYKKIYQLTGNKKGSQDVAFGGTVQYDTYKKFLEKQLDIAVKHDNVQSGLSYSTSDVNGMSLENVKDQYGANTRVYDIRKKLEDENNKIKKETIDLMADLIQKNATIEQQIEDENRNYERQLELINGIEDPQMRQRAKEGADKTHNENSAKLQFEQFKQESDWVTIFDDLDRVGTSTINSMIDKIDDFSKTTGLSVEVVKQLRDALDKLRTESIERNPLPSVFGGVHRGNAIGSFVNSRFRNGMDISTTTFVGEKDAKKMGIKSGNYTKGQLQNEQQGAYNDSSKAISSLTNKLNGLTSVLGPVNDLFKALGDEDSVIGKVTGGASSALGAASQVSGGLSAMGLSSLGPYGAAAGAALSVASSLVSAFGADYSSYNKAKEQYDNLSSIWDALISKKTEYMNIHWGTEATEASREAQKMLEAEIEQTKIIAQKRLSSGASAGSHSIGYRMWKGSYKYNGQNWRDIAPEISRKYGVQFNDMSDLLNMNSDTLSKIKQDYVGFWANLDGDYRDYLEKLIEYGDKADDMIENLTEKLTGNKFSSLVESWGDAMASMANSSDNLVDNFEDNLKKTILNSMIENIYGKKIKDLLEKTQKYAENGDKITDGSGNVISEYTGAEYADVKESTDDLAKQIEATRDFLKKTYGWSDNSSSSSTNSVKGITEEEANLGLSYLNSIRLDVSVIRSEQAKYFPEMSEIAKAQLTQLNQIAQHTLRNADAAERIEAVVTSFNDNFNRVINGTKVLHVK